MATDMELRLVWCWHVSRVLSTDSSGNVARDADTADVDKGRCYVTEECRRYISASLLELGARGVQLAQ